MIRIIKFNYKYSVLMEYSGHFLVHEFIYLIIGCPKENGF